MRRAAVVFLLVLGCGLAGASVVAMYLDLSALVAWDNPTAGVVLVDAALIAVALWIVAARAHGARRPAS